MGNNVTLQDIADALDLSRNTVSKVLNGYPNVPDSTRDRVLAQAMKMNYKRLSYSLFEKKGTKVSREIMLLTRLGSLQLSFWTLVLQGIAEKLSQRGYELKLTALPQSDLDQCRLPAAVSDRTAGFICADTFSLPFLQALQKQGLPTVLLEAPPEVREQPLPFDIVMMENRDSMRRLTTFLIREKGHRRIGFIGNPKACLSNLDRYLGFCEALAAAGLPVDEACCLLEEHSAMYRDLPVEQPLGAAGFSNRFSSAFHEWLSAQFDKLPALPTAIVCASDSLAIETIQVLKERGVKVPQDMAVAGFGDVPEALIIEPHLTTVHTPKIPLGAQAAEELISRLEYPGSPAKFVFLQTELKIRGST
ncbi:LacI family DNA-binding transcriptional regulator [Allofournierella sp.]|uniref:LacI family DNA-binding transcriptional regulator n=1 Tax=Allofournierella sp. TaxID=1940256 RepID=UPI003AB2A141